MTEEITYAALEFNKSYEMENISKPSDTEEKGLPASSATWRLAALILFTLCLALLAGILVLGVVFFQVSNHFEKQIGILMRNQETLRTNFSKKLQDLEDNLCLEGEEKNNNKNGPSCTLCPANWQWMGGDTCFYISIQKRSWEESKKFCSLQNSTLLMLKERDKLKFLPPRDNGQYYWIGLHKSKENNWYWEDGSALLVQKTDWIELYPPYKCGYLYGKKISTYEYCTQNHFWICEKTAVKLWYSDIPKGMLA